MPLNEGGRGRKVLEELQENVTRLVAFTPNTQAYLVNGSHNVFVTLILAQEEITSVLIGVISDKEDNMVVSGAKATQCQQHTDWPVVDLVVSF